MKKIILSVFTILLIFVLVGCKKKEPRVYTSFYFDTFIEIKILDSVDDEVVDGLDDLIYYYDSLFSENGQEGILAEINSDATEIELDDETAYLIEFMIKGAELTDGLYDPTIYGDAVLWDFSDSQNGVIPDEKLIAEALSHTGYDKITLKGNTLIKNDPEVKISFGSVAKGYVADKISEYLHDSGVRSAVINLGGNVLCMGYNVNNNGPFLIGIQKPFEENKCIETIPIVSLGNTSVVTSGIYERYFKIEDVIYHHIFDTATGYPLNNGLYSVTIKGESSLVCDFLSTAYFVSYGNEKIFNRLRYSYPDYSVLLITSEYEKIKY